jgi:prevent-host-death family protein
MTRVSVSEIKAQLSAYLALVRGGETVLVTDRGRVVAQLCPAPEPHAVASRSEDLIQTGRMRAPRLPLPKNFEESELPRDAKGRSLEGLLRERSEGW